MFVTANWGWPQWAFIIIALIGLGAALANSGKYVETSSVGTMIISTILEIVIFIAGGFFDEMHWPQVTIIILFIISLAIKLADDSRYRKESFLATLIADAIVIFILASGGFFR